MADNHCGDVLHPGGYIHLPIAIQSLPSNTSCKGSEHQKGEPPTDGAANGEEADIALLEPIYWGVPCDECDAKSTWKPGLAFCFDV